MIRLTCTAMGNTRCYAY